MRKIKKGDEVIIIAGRDKGRKGKVLSVLLADTKGIMKKYKVKVEGIQMVKKTMKPNPQLGKPGGIIEKEAWIDISNIAILNPVTQKADKIKINVVSKVDADGKEIRERVRHFKSNDEIVDIA